MDQQGLERQLHEEALRGLARVHRVSGTVGTLWKQILPIVERDRSHPWHVLDLACGGGDICIGLWKLARRRPAPLRFSGCDISQTAIEFARKQSRRVGADIDFFHSDAIRDPWPEGVDILCSSFFLHHLAEEEVRRFFSGVKNSGVQALLVSDLLRSRRGYFLAWTGVRLLTRSRICHTDGPRSVQAAFTLEEIRLLAKQAGLQGCELSRHWPERFLLHWERD